MRKKSFWPLPAAFLLVSGAAHAAHPRISDDTGTRGKGTSQLEFTGEFDHDSVNGTTTD